ncbi:hypothetical protein PG990_000032 [Apiospora arundinis]
MSSTNDAGSFSQEATTVVVTFKSEDDGRDQNNHDQRQDHSADDDERRDGHKLRLGFKACHSPPITTFRFHVNIFGHDDTGKKEKTTLYFDIPPHHVASLEATFDVEKTELDADGIEYFTGGVTRVRFQLKRPGNLVQPVRDLSLKPASQRTFTSMALLADTLDFVLFMPHTTLSKEQFRCLHQTVTSPTPRHDRQERIKEHKWWLGALYGGAGGKLVNASPVDDNDVSTASESGESTIATATPPAYRRSSLDDDEAAATAPNKEPTTNDASTADCPPPYDLPKSEAGNSAPADDIKGKQPRKRLRDSEDLDVRLYRRRLFSPPRPLDGGQSPSDLFADTSCFEKLDQLRHPVAVVLSKLEQVLKRAQETEEENRTLRAELAAMRERQDALNARLEEVIDQNRQHVKRTEDLETESADLDSRVLQLEERHGELEDRQGKTEEKCDTIEIEITDQVHSALRDRLIGALETM